MKKKKIVIIGGGFGGLSAAIRLASKGHDIQLFEKRERLGGRAYRYEINNFRFDGGPTVITAPHIIDEVFEAAGKKKEDYIDLVPLDIFYRFFHPDGSWFDYTGSVDKLAQEVERISPSDVPGFRRFSKQVKAIFDLFSAFTDRPFRNVWDMIRIILPAYRVKGHIGTYRFVSRYIKNPFLRQVFSSHPLLIGGSPINTPAFYTLIAQFEREWGLYYSMGGTYAIIEAFEQLIREKKGKIHLNTEVTEILFEGRTVRGVRLADGSEVASDVVICNSDLAHTYLNMIPRYKRLPILNWRLKNMNYSISLFVYYFGTRKRYLDSNLQHHNLIMGPNYREHMRELFNGKKIPDDLFLYLHMPTRTDPGISPEGTELFYVLSLVPNLKVNADWKTLGPHYRDRIVKYLEKNFLPGLEDHIIAEHFIDPIHFQEVLNSYKGAAFAATPKLTQTAYLRPLNKSIKYENLYFVGAGTHPGPGVPAVISSGKIVAEMIHPTL